MFKVGEHGNINLSNFCHFDARKFATSDICEWIVKTMISTKSLGLA
jgi:hypothetical protein